ncbi:MAG: histidine kinase [Eubacteriales bacterium]|nr:histidine kinase [Eubacteriales bacterium]
MGKIKKLFRHLNLYHKFALAMIALGLFPMLILTTVMSNRMLEGYREALEENYEQAAVHAASSVENMLSVYDNASKLSYQYNFGEGTVYEDYTDYDNLRRVLTGEIYEPGERSQRRALEMQQFLRQVESTDGYIYAAHFLGETEAGEQLDFHFSTISTYFRDLQAFCDSVAYESWDRKAKTLQLVVPHGTAYFGGMERTVFSLARNYYDLRGAVGQEKYVGTLFLDVDMEKLRLIFKKMQLQGDADFYLINEAGDCFYATRTDCIGVNLERQGKMPQESEAQLVVLTKTNPYGLRVLAAVDTQNAFAGLYSVRYTMYAFLAAAGLLLVLASFWFSRRLTRPIHSMMEQMGQIGGGHFDLELPVETNDEIGVLSARFNQMSRELKKYIDQSYLARIRQNEAELTALKSQIYPHFLYNTLEIIRMTALENQDQTVSQMIEALSEQIHYLIGPMQDMVPLEKEIDIVRRYVYLLNCRIQGKVLLQVNAPGSGQVTVPKLILQPIVENAYVHGIKPKNGRGSILVEAEQKDGKLSISVMDNGTGMDQEALARLEQLLAGDAPGVKNEYNWQSIGLKNVHDRIRFLYGETYGIRVTSTAGVGTIVEVLLPCPGGENHAENDFGR